MKPSQRKPVFIAVDPRYPNMRRFVGYEGDPGVAAAVIAANRDVTRPRRPGLSGYSNPAGFRNMSGSSNARGFRNLSGLSGSQATDAGGRIMPNEDGSPGHFLDPYDETMMWGTNDPAAMVTPPIDPSLSMPQDEGLTQIDPGISIPFGVSVIPWRNPTTMQSVPILASTPVNVPVLSLNMTRNALIVQNNSTATAPDVAPTFYVGFNAQPQVGLALALAPGAGILFDVITPRDAVFVLFGPQVNGGGTVVIQGAVVQGTYAPI